MTRAPVWLAVAACCLGSALVAPISSATATPAQPQAQKEVQHQAQQHGQPTVLGPGDDDTVAPMSYPGLPLLPGRRAAVPRRVRILVMRVFWSPSPPTYPDTGQMKALMKDTARWFARASRGRHHVASTVTPWLRIPGGHVNCGDLYGSTRRAIGAAKAHGTRPDGFNRYMIVMPQCGTNSQGEMPGRVTWIRERLTHLDVLTHELGHNLGLDHANSLICQADKRRVTQGGRCAEQEYGDLWDAMGISTRPFSVGVLKRLGWAGRVPTATRSGSWTLRDAEKSGKGLQGLRVKVSRKVSYWLEYHTTDIANAKEPGSFEVKGTPGLQIRLDTGAKSLRILDAAPGNPDELLFFPDPDLVNATLPVGSSFTTPQKVRITLVSQDATTARVRVSFGRRAGVPDAPTLVSAITDTNSYDGAARLSIKPGASDNGQVVLGYLATQYPGGRSTFVPDPGGSRTTLTVPINGPVPQQWTVRAVNQVGASAESGRVEHHVPAPVVTFVSPTPGAVVPGPELQVVLDVQPDALTHSPVQSVKVCLDDSYTCETDNAAPWSVVLSTGDGSHVLRAFAQDESGSYGSATAAVTLVPAPPTVTIGSPSDGATVTAGEAFTVDVTPTPNAATGRPIDSVAFAVYPSGSPDMWDGAYDDAAPWTATFTLYTPGTYRIEVVASDGFYDSAPASVTIVVPDPGP